eukprot:37728_1
MTDLDSIFNEMSKTQKHDRLKATKLLLKIMKNILNNLSEIQKYGNLNFQKIEEKLSKCKPGLYLLFMIGFKITNNGQRLMFVSNNNSIKTLKNVYYSLKTTQELTESGFTFNEAIEAMKMSTSVTLDNKNDEKNNNEWDCKICKFKNILSSNVCTCMICGTNSNKDVWNCSFCTFINRTETLICLMCGTQRVLLSFVSNLNTCNKSGNTSSIISSCQCLQRICVGMKYFNWSGNHNNKTETFVQFCIETYKDFLNDYIHIIKNHSNDFKCINDELINKYGFNACDISKCDKFGRHFARDMKTETQENATDAHDIKHSFYSAYYDTLHFNIFHLFDMSLRTESTDITVEFNENNMETYVLYDTVFAQKRDAIRETKQKHSHNIERFDENNKFNITVSTEENTANTDSTCGTFTDGLYKYIQNNINMDAKRIIEFQKYISENEYDTDVIINETNSNKQSNINAQFGSKILLQIKEYIKYNNLLSISFSTGIWWNYWSHGSYFDSQLKEVSPYYGSLKEEIIASGFVSITQWYEKIFFKAQQLIHTNEAKIVKLNKWIAPKWGLSINAIIAVSNLISIICYCDWSKLSTHFSGTFRKNSMFEPIELVKQRNSKYYYFGKLLAETANLFGICGAFLGEEYTWERGPFFCGINCVLNIPSFAMTFTGPNSTTKQIEVAMNFATRDGMIMELQNRGSGALQFFFDCSWVSKYAEEDERLFMFGESESGLRMVSIRIIETAQNYQFFCRAFYTFDVMVSGNILPNKFIINKSVIDILNMLINSKVNGTQHRFDQYVNDTFDSYCLRKTSITIIFRVIDTYFSKLKHLILRDVVNYGIKNGNRVDNKSEHKNNDATSNLLKSQIFKIFPNLEYVELFTTTKLRRSNGDYPIHMFSLSSFLSLIECQKPTIKYYVCANRRQEKDGQYTGVTWLHNIKTFSTDKGWNIIKNRKPQRDELAIVKSEGMEQQKNNHFQFSIFE